MCDALSLGHLVRQLHKLELWPGTPSDVARRVKSTSVHTLLTKVKSMECPVLPKEPYSASHVHCGFSSVLCQRASSAASKAGVVESHRRYMEKQRQKLEPSKIHLTKFQRQNTSRTI